MLDATLIGSDASSLGKIGACWVESDSMSRPSNMNPHKLVEDVRLPKSGFLVLEERVTLLLACKGVDHWEGPQSPWLFPIFPSSGYDRPGLPPHPFSDRSGISSAGMEHLSHSHLGPSGPK